MMLLWGASPGAIIPWGVYCGGGAEEVMFEVQGWWPGTEVAPVVWIVSVKGVLSVESEDMDGL